MNAHTGAAGGSPDSKAVLFCSACDRSAPIDDARLDRHRNRTDVECPDCGAVVVSQPQFESDSRHRAISA
jgi:DNA-directed RNA polymerase subunit RPC12/RpoP